MKETVEKRVYIGIAIAVAVLGLIAWASITGNNMIGQHLSEVTRTQQLVSELNDLLILVTDMETSERGFVITGDSTYLAPYQRARTKIDAQLVQFYSLIRNQEAKAYMDSLRIRVYAKFEIMETTIRVRSMQGFAEAAAMTNSGAGEAAMSDVRDVVIYMQKLENDYLNERLILADESFRRSSMIVAAETSIAMILILIASVILYKDITARKKVEASLRVERAQLESFIGNAPIPMMLLGDHLNILTYSRRFGDDFKSDQPIAAGLTFPEVFPDLYLNFKDGFKDARQGLDVLNPEATLIAADGSERFISWMIHSMPDDDGGKRFILVAYRIDELVEARKRAIEASEAKSSFLARISHELRTPLNAVLGYAQILQKSKNLADQEQQYVGTMYRSGHHLLNMINDILDISKIESGKMDLIEVDFNLPELLQDLQSMFNLKCKEKGISLVTDYQDPVPGAVVGDPNKLRQILINLLGNAIKFTNSGSVTLRLRHSGTYDLLFEVEDTGPGIPQDSLDTIFMPFQQVKGKYQEGTGLGLAISRKLTELMGGTISVSSEIGKGSHFHVAIPLRASTAVFSGSRQHPKQISGLSNGKTYRILVVDDIPPNREVARVMLEAIGFEVMEAENGQLAVDAYKEKPFDLILMDIIMPVLDGIGAMSAIRALPNGTDVPIIALTASGFEGKNVELKRQGFTEYVRKPFYEPDLLELIGNLIGAEYEYEELAPNPETKEVGVDDIVAYLRTFSDTSQFRINEAMEEQDFDAILSVLKDEPPAPEHLAVSELFTSILERADYFQLTQVAKRYQDV